jgi:hypothetical protein
MNSKRLFGLFGRVIVSVIFAGIFYFCWMAIAIPVLKSDLFFAKVLCWLSAPVVTAAGFACGIAIFELLPSTRKSELRDTVLWPLIGCSIGAAVVFPFGPMLIVFAMFALGAASIFTKEIVRIRAVNKRKKASPLRRK